MCDHVVLLYVIRCTCCTLYVMHYTCHTIVRSHHYTMALIWHSPSHGAISGADHWEFIEGGIEICKAVKLQRFDCIGLRRVRLVMWLAKQGWHTWPRAGQSASHNININHPCHRLIISSIIIIASLIIIIIDHVLFHSKSSISFFPYTYVVLVVHLCIVPCAPFMRVALR